MKKIKILVVDDEIKLLQTVTEFLTLQNFSVMQASSGSEALKIFTENKKEIELILLDLMLPDISGYSVLREIRKISDVPVIILSARSEVTVTFPIQITRTATHTYRAILKKPPATMTPAAPTRSFVSPISAPFCL